MRRRRRGSRRAIGRRPSGGAATGVPAARTRIRATGSRRRIAPSARGRKRIPRRSAIGTSPDTRRSRAASGATNRSVLRVAIGRGRISPAVIAPGAIDRLATASVRGRGNRPIDQVHHANANPGRTSRRTARRPAIARGRQSPPGRARSESRGSASHRPIGHGAASRRVATDRLTAVARRTLGRAEVVVAILVPGIDRAEIDRCRDIRIKR